MSYDLLPKKYLEYLSLGAEIAVSLALPILLGYFIDQRFDVYPIGLLIGCLMGMVLFIGTMIRISKKLGDGKDD